MADAMGALFWPHFYAWCSGVQGVQGVRLTRHRFTVAMLASGQTSRSEVSSSSSRGNINHVIWIYSAFARAHSSRHVQIWYFDFSWIPDSDPKELFT